jgi:PTH1 family peptidyl-tRNA hydrolase
VKYLIAGLGNIGSEYSKTRHNIGFMVLDALADASNIFFSSARYADVAELKYKGRHIFLIKPNTFMNLSGKAVNYWLQAEKIPLSNLLVVTDDLALPFGKLRLRPKGSDGGHNGLKNINQMLNSQEYARLRFGIGNEFAQGKQVNYVLDAFDENEQKTLQERIDLATEFIKSFCTAGLQRTMNDFNQR